MTALSKELGEWGDSRGYVGTAWTFELPGFVPPLESTLIADIAFLTFEDAVDLTEEELDVSRCAPSVAIEVRSPEDRPRNIETKIALYLQAGTRLVLDVDPETRTITSHDASGTLCFTETTTFEHHELAGFKLDLAAFFEKTEASRQKLLKLAGGKPPRYGLDLS